MFGVLYLSLWSINISAEIPEELTTAPIEFLETDPELEEAPKLTAINTSKVETNRAYNEAEKFIRESEKERLENPLKQENLISTETNQTIFSSDTKNAIEAAKKRLSENQENRSALSKKNKVNTTNGYSRKTTISFSLKSRTAISLKNPVYTCEGGGKVVINIEVDSNGSVVKTSFNKNASSTINGCLIESAITYAEEAQFSKSTTNNQLGSVTYNFPGQD